MNVRVRGSAWFGVAVCLALSASVAVAQVNLPEGFEVVEFGVSPRLTGVPQINECGQIVFGKSLENHVWVLYLYDNGRIREVARENDGGLPFPDINDAGTIVYMSGRFNDPDSFRVKQIDAHGNKTRIGRGFDPSINNEGVIAAELYRDDPCGPVYDIVLYEDGHMTRLTDNPFSEQGVELNDSRQTVWTRYDFCQSPWVSETPLYSDGEITILPTEASQPTNPDVNNRTQVAWLAGRPIELWENGTTRQITDSGGAPELNDLGDIAFDRWDDDAQTLDKWLYRVSGGEPTFYRLTEDPVRDTVGDINNWTEAAWRYIVGGGNRSGGVRFLRRVRTGDSEFDGDIDLVDYGAFAECMTGPGRVDGLCDCRFLDVDFDGDVDLGDFARFQNAYGGG